MKKNVQLIGGATIALAIVTMPALLLPQSGQNAGSSCSPVGAWFGGGLDSPSTPNTVKYTMFISQNDGNTFTLVFDGAYTQAKIGVPVATIVPGVLKKRPHGQWKYEGAAGVLINRSDAFPPATKPDLVVIHYRAKFDGCDTLIVQHDFFGGYAWDSNKTPLVDAPDYRPAPTPIYEVYKRLETTCPICTE
jgi:hypothetical protein